MACACADIGSDIAAWQVQVPWGLAKFLTSLLDAGPKILWLWCRPGPEGVQRERPTGLVVFATALRCVPYVWPDVWAQNTAKLAEDLSCEPLFSSQQRFSH